MATLQGAIQVVVTGGVPAATMQGQTLADGTYLISVSQDNTGVNLNVLTPYGSTGQSGFQKGDAVG